MGQGMCGEILETLEESCCDLVGRICKILKVEVGIIINIYTHTYMNMLCVFIKLCCEVSLKKILRTLILHIVISPITKCETFLALVQDME